MKSNNNQINRFSFDVIKRFTDKLSISENGCIEWNGEKDKDGYGRIRIGGRDGKKEYTHRWALEFALGGVKLPANLKSCHQCDNPSCVNPLHLFVGTQKDNMQDASNKGRTNKITHNSVLNAEIANVIRHSTDETTVLAHRYGVTPGAIRAIKRNESWK